MMRVAPIVTIALGLLLCGCAIDKRYWSTGVSTQEWQEIELAMRKYTSARVDLCSRGSGEGATAPVMVTTEEHGDYEHWWARKIKDKWHIELIRGVIMM
jgi:hypothetical protein